MFDIGFWELVLIAIMGLVILGPERLPSAIGTLSRWMASVRQTANSLKAELNHELHVKELHSNLKKAEQQGMGTILDPELRASVEKLKEAAESVQRPFADTQNSAFASQPEANDEAAQTQSSDKGNANDGNTR